MKILYLIHIDWNWIFQRPQILALALDKNNDCTVVEQKTILKPTSNLAKNNKKPKKIRKIRYKEVVAQCFEAVK